MKRIITLLLLLAMMTSLAACAAPAETAQSEAPAQTEAATPSPTVEPTPTPELFTEEEKEYLEYIDLLGFIEDKENDEYDLITNPDLYALLLLGDAYNKGKLEKIIDENKLTTKQINILVESASWSKERCFIEHDLFSEESQEDTEYSGIEALIKILRGDTGKLTLETLDNIQTNFQQLILGNEQPYSANPKESRENIDELIALFNDAVETQNVEQFDTSMNSSEYNVLEKWQVIEYCLLHGSDDIEWQSPTVVYEGEEMLFVEYAINSGLVEKIHNEVEDFLTENYMIDEDKGKIFEIR